MCLSSFSVAIRKIPETGNLCRWRYSWVMVLETEGVKSIVQASAQHLTQESSWCIIAQGRALYGGTEQVC